MKRLLLATLLAACSKTAPPAPVAVEVPVASVASAVPIVIDAGAVRPSRDVAFEPAPPGAFAGTAGNVDADITSLAASGDVVIAAGNGFLLRSVDRGLHFVRSERPIQFPVVAFASPDEVFVGGAHGVLRSTDGGVTFALAGTPPAMPQAMFANGADLWVAGGLPPFVARSSDHGTTFTKLATPLKDGALTSVTTTTGKDIVVSGHEQQGPYASDPVVLRSMDAGKTWRRLPPFRKEDDEQTRCVCATEGVLFASAMTALWMSRDLGKTWKIATPMGSDVTALACRGQEVIVGGRTRTLLVSHDLGATWEAAKLAGFPPDSLASPRAITFAPTGEAYVAFESLGGLAGSLFRRSPP